MKIRASRAGAAVDMGGLTACEKVVLCILAMEEDLHGRCVMSRREIAERAGIPQARSDSSLRSLGRKHLVRSRSWGYEFLFAMKFSVVQPQTRRRPL